MLTGDDPQWAPRGLDYGIGTKGRNPVVKILRDCFGSRTRLLLALGALAVVLGLLAWGAAPKLVLSALPLLGLAACLVPCLLPLYWLRRTASTAPNALAADDRDEPRPLTRP